MEIEEIEGEIKRLVESKSLKRDLKMGRSVSYTHLTLPTICSL